jgi:hypothetical protein
MLILRPLGRGNWSPIVLAITESKHSPLPLEVHVGQQWTLAGRIFRISKVLP